MNKKKINSIIEAPDISPEDIVFLLSLTDKGDAGLLRQAAYDLTPQVVLVNYQLYEGKPCINEGRDECRSCLQRRVESTGRIVGWNEYGDPRHFYQCN